MRRLVCILLFFAAALLPIHGSHGQGSLFYDPNLSDEGGRNSLNYRDVFDSRGQYLTNYRGVFLQAIAGFRDNNGALVEPNQVQIETDARGQPCLRIRTNDCLRFQLSGEQLKAILRFVEAGRYGAYTAPWSSRDATALIDRIRGSMVVASDGKNWIAPELNTPEFERIFAYVDFDRPFPFVSAAFRSDRARSTRDRINSSLGNSQQIEQMSLPDLLSILRNSTDGTYMNTDIDANFVARAFSGHVVCDGLPARFQWVLPEGRQFPLVLSVRYARPDFANDEHRQYFTDAQAVFCTTAILRALHSVRAPSLSRLR